MENFIPGQRWISNSESELGLGLIREVAKNRVVVLFLASNQTRVYAWDNSPLTRVKFAPGDNIESISGEKLNVVRLIEHEGLITYVGKNRSGQEIRLDEMELNPHIQFNKPQDRLFSGQFDPSFWFSLRYQTWQRLRRHQQFPVKGLLGGRTSLIPHQIHIAHESANRLAPRIMLADQVGLGKTIEAGLILHHRLINGLSRRILIIVPETLLHQWLVEMLRRFNLHFRIIDEESCRSNPIDDDLNDEVQVDDLLLENPFENEQLVLCSQTFFGRDPQRQQQALAAGWDMVIVDEAHHLEWSEEAPSPEYLFVAQLGQSSPSLLLLTATPEQLGKASHFARLKLLDPDRFYSFADYLEEERLFEPVANAAKALLADASLSAATRTLLAALMKDDNVDGLLEQLDDPETSDNARHQLLNALLDYHGTSRILFRNSRHSVQGFPERECHGYALKGESPNNDLQQDPRYQWLSEKIRQLSGQKALLICKEQETAIALEQVLRHRAGIASALFHEGMTIIERDRAAAYFADQESSARLLICSEIGSEGRNFQFVHHLILWDLPRNPDLLQQRIGRLDRIGQKYIIQIHVPYLENTAHQLLFRWYDEGLNAFRSNSSAAQPVADSLRNELDTVLMQSDPKGMAALIDKTRALHAELEIRLHNGRDQLLELNSCRTGSANELIRLLKDYENEGDLWPYLETVFDCYGVETEYHSPDCYILRPGDHLRIAHFPELAEDGMTVTVARDCALVREDFQFLTWEHPMVISAMDLVLSSETGNATVSVVRQAKLKAGQFLLECLFVAECSAPEELQIGRFLPPTPMRVLIDQNKQDLSDAIEHSSLSEVGITFDKAKIVEFINRQRHHIAHMLITAEQKARAEMQGLLSDASNHMRSSLSHEIKRLARLKKVNPAIKPEEIEHLQEQMSLAQENIQAAQLKLDAIRFIITS